MSKDAEASQRSRASKRVSHEVDSNITVLCRAASDFLGQSLEYLPSPFPCRECLIRSTVYRSLTHGFRRCTKSLRRAPSRPCSAPDLSASASLPGVSALLATSRERVHLSRRIPCLRYVPSSSFLSSSTVCSALSLAGLFHPAAASRVHPRSGALTPRAAPPGSSPGATPMPLGTSMLAEPCGPTATPECLDFEVFFRARTRGSCRRG